MPSEAEEHGKAPRVYAVTPLVLFAADWAALRYRFEPGVQVVRSDDVTNAKLVASYETGAEFEDQYATMMRVLRAEEVLKSTEWLFVTDAFGEAAHVPRERKEEDYLIEDVDFGDYSGALRNAFLDSFTTALKMVRSSGVVTPFLFQASAEFSDDRIYDVEVKSFEWNERFLQEYEVTFDWDLRRGETYYSEHNILDMSA
jgi:hypothetical protein